MKVRDVAVVKRGLPPMRAPVTGSPFTVGTTAVRIPASGGFAAGAVGISVETQLVYVRHFHSGETLVDATNASVALGVSVNLPYVFPVAEGDFLSLLGAAASAVVRVSQAEV